MLTNRRSRGTQTTAKHMLTKGSVRGAQHLQDMMLRNRRSHGARQFAKTIMLNPRLRGAPYLQNTMLTNRNYHGAEQITKYDVKKSPFSQSSKLVKRPQPNQNKPQPNQSLLE